jgi:ABC-type sugar transport system substrate-binding protein
MARPLQIDDEDKAGKTGTERRGAMKTLIRALAGMAAASPAFAAGAEAGTGGGILLYLFIGFAALIIVFQAVPSVVLFATMVKEVFVMTREKVTGTK